MSTIFEATTAPSKTMAMILAAGLGTRLKPWTDNHPKALAVVNGKSLLQQNILYLQKFGIRQVVVNVHHFASQVLDAVQAHNGWGSEVFISNESHEVLETGGGFLNAAPFFKQATTVVLMNVDVLTDLDLLKMLAYHNQQRPLATLASTSRQTARYLLFNPQNNLNGWVNTQTGQQKGELMGNETQKAFSGIHIIDTSFFTLVKQQGKFSMIDAYLSLMNEFSIKSFDHSGGKFIDVGKPGSIVAAEELFNNAE